MGVLRELIEKGISGQRRWIQPLISVAEVEDIKSAIEMKKMCGWWVNPLERPSVYNIRKQKQEPEMITRSSHKKWMKVCSISYPIHSLLQ